MAVIALKWPTLHIPYYWDEAGAYFNPSLWLSSRELIDAFPGRHPAEMFFGHPPLLYLLMGGLFKLFGPAPAVAHALMILFAALGILYTYRLGVLLFSRDIAIGAAILLLATPLFFAQAGMFLGDIPVAASGVAAVYYYFRRSRCQYLLFATAAVLMKEHAALLIVMLLLYDCCTLSGPTAENRSKLLYGVPLVILGIFFLTQKLTTGSFLPNPYFNSNPFFSLSVEKIIFKIAFANYWAFFAQGRFLLTLVIVMAVWRFRKSLPAGFFLFIMIVGSYVAAYSFIYFIPRYILIITPFICLSGSASLALLLKDRFRYAAAVVLLSLTSSLLPDIRSRGYDNFETSMQYLDVVSIHQQAGTYLQRVSSGGLIYAPWPLSSVWADIAFGYVATPLSMTTDPNSPWQYIVFTPQADRAQAEAIDGLIRKGGMKRIARFERSGKEVEVFSRNATDIMQGGL
jgi:hypothetical protein